MPLSRRHFLATAACAVASPLAAQSDPWRAVAEAAGGLEQLHAIRVEQRGGPVLVERFRGPALGTAVPIKSVSKTVVAALLGTAIDAGEIPGLDATLGETAPRLIPAGADPRVAGITVGDLVTLRAGLERTSGGNYGAWVSSGNWVADALSRPIVAEPGGRMLYSTGSTHVLGAVLSEATGRSLLDLARARLGRPLGIDIPAWTRDPQGRYLGGNEMALSPEAMTRFGQMFLQGGTFEGRRVLSDAWVTRSFQPVTRSQFSGLGYGLGWFLGRAGGDDYALARGYGGQVILVVPSLDLVAAITSDPLRPARSGGYFGDLMTLIETRLLPAARAA